MSADLMHSYGSQVPFPDLRGQIFSVIAVDWALFVLAHLGSIAEG
jgi:hypothetical protein